MLFCEQCEQLQPSPTRDKAVVPQEITRWLHDIPKAVLGVSHAEWYWRALLHVHGVECYKKASCAADDVRVT